MPDAALIDEVREIRHRIAEECENNIGNIKKKAGLIFRTLCRLP